ncbi:hypothetical protein MTO96_007814 [Rhipicephalus appendiculatus]
MPTTSPPGVAQAQKRRWNRVYKKRSTEPKRFLEGSRNKSELLLYRPVRKGPRPNGWKPLDEVNIELDTKSGANIPRVIADMAQSTGLEVTGAHVEEGTTSRDGTMPRRTSLSDSGATIVESLFTSLDSSTMATATKKQLVDELRTRGLQCSGRKDELIARLIRHNTSRLATDPTDASTNDQAANYHDRQTHLETLSADNEGFRAELNSLRAQLNRVTTNGQRQAPYYASLNTSSPTERVTTSNHGLHHYASADATMASGSTQSSTVNNGANPDAACHEATIISTHGAEPSMAQILAALVNTRVLLANSLSRGAATVNEALDLLDEARRRVTINGLKMDLRKCQLIQSKVSFLGYVIFAEGRPLGDARVAAVDKFEPHRNA